jgi:hypothetical protein
MLLTVCIEAGRKTLTHTSWTGLAPVSRKWMSGQAAALAALNDRWLFLNSTAPPSLRDPDPRSARRPPSPLDFYLSWMSPVSPPLPSVDSAVTVQAPAMFMPEFPLELLLLPLLLQATGSSANAPPSKSTARKRKLFVIEFSFLVKMFACLSERQRRGCTKYSARTNSMMNGAGPNGSEGAPRQKST